MSHRIPDEKIIQFKGFSSVLEICSTVKWSGSIQIEVESSPGIFTCHKSGRVSIFLKIDLNPRFTVGVCG